MRYTKITIVAVSLIALLAIAGVAYAVVGDTMKNEAVTNSDEVSVIATQNRPIVYTTEDSFTRYFQGLRTNMTTLDEDTIHQVPVVNWNTQAIVAVPFDVLSSQTYTGVSVETIDNNKVIFVAITDSPKNCLVTQDNRDHVAFLRIDQTDKEAAYTVSIRISPNQARCDN